MNIDTIVMNKVQTHFEAALIAEMCFTIKYFFKPRYTKKHLASQVVLVVKNLPANAGDVRGAGPIPGLGRSPGGGHGNPHQFLAWRILWTEEPSEL